MNTLVIPPQKDIEQQVEAALREDIGDGDVTAQLLTSDEKVSAKLICREQAVICGIPWAQEVLKQIQAPIDIHWMTADGDRVGAQTVIARLSGTASAMLTVERTLLNFLQTLSATATQTWNFVLATQEFDVRILDTRKTLPGLRSAQKYAVCCGGGENHRQGLFDAFLIKENHIHAAGSIEKAVTSAREKNKDLLLEVEVENLSELEQAIAAAPDRILLDNFKLSDIETAIELCQHQIPLEASGGITLENIVEVAKTGIDFISVGTLTKDVKAIDFSLLFVTSY